MPLSTSLKNWLYQRVKTSLPDKISISHPDAKPQSHKLTINFSQSEKMFSFPEDPMDDNGRRVPTMGVKVYYTVLSQDFGKVELSLNPRGRVEMKFMPGADSTSAPRTWNIDVKQFMNRGYDLHQPSKLPRPVLEYIWAMMIGYEEFLPSRAANSAAEVNAE